MKVPDYSDLLNKPYEKDCLGLMLEMYSRVGFNINLFQAPRGWAWEDVHAPREMDIVFINDGSHCGLYVGGGTILHVQFNGIVCHVPFDQWQNRLDRIARLVRCQSP